MRAMLTHSRNPVAVALRGGRWPFVTRPCGYSGVVKVDVVIEIPRGSRNKYEWDERRRVMRFDRSVAGAVAFPADYGFIPQTCSDDGDPLDALVLLDEPTFPGIWVLTRPVGVCWTDAGKYQEPKIICVPVNDPSYTRVRDLGDLPDVVRDEIQQFFNVYKDFDDGHDSRFMRFDDHNAAKAVIRNSRT